MSQTIQYIRRVAICGTCIGKISLKDLLKYKDEELCYIQIIEDNKNPELIFADGSIYHHRETYNKFCKLTSENPNAIRVFVTNELLFADFNVFDYAVMFSSKDNNSERIIRHPLKRFGVECEFDINKKYDMSIIKSKSKFCNFYYSNGSAHPYRDYLFYEISKYKLVDSIGKHLNNQKNKKSFTRNDLNWYVKSIEDRKPFKFTISCENAYSDGYCTEKIITALQADTIPIYFGDRSIHKRFNTKRFINCHDYDSIEGVLERIKEIDQNDELYLKVLNEPWMLPEQIKDFEKREIDYINFLKFVLTSDIKKIKMRPEGSWPDHYYNFFTKRFELKDDIKDFKYKVIIWLNNNKIGRRLIETYKILSNLICKLTGH